MIHQNLPNVNFNIKINVVNITTQNQSKLLPKHPITLPFVPTEEKIHKLESWLLNQFSPSTFDITSQPLPLLSRKPQKLHIVDDGISYAAHYTISVPHHWKEDVKKNKKT